MKDKSKKNVIAWTYFAAIVVMLLSLLSDFLLTNAYAKPTAAFFCFLRDAGKLFFDNAGSFTILFCLLFTGSVFFSQVWGENDQDSKNHAAAFIMLCICLILTNRLYKTAQLRTFLTWLGENFWETFGFLAGNCLVMLIGSFLKKRKDLSQKFANGQQEPPADNPTPPGSLEDNGKKQTNPSQSRIDTWIISGREKAQLRAINRLKRIEKRHENRLERMQYDVDFTSPWEKILAFAITFTLIGLVILSLVKGDSDSSFYTSVVDKLNTALCAILGIISGENQDQAMQILFGLGGLVLVIFVALMLYYLVYFFARTLAYFFLHTREDERFFKESAQGLKLFFYGIVESVERLLLFVRDFLEVVFEILLCVDLQQMIHDRFPPKKKKTNENNQAPSEEQTEAQQPAGSGAGSR